MFSVTEVLVEVPISDKIKASKLSNEEKDQFLKLICYFTPAEIEDLKTLL